jgi:hypothetical protein
MKANQNLLLIHATVQFNPKIKFLFDKLSRYYTNTHTKTEYN